MKIVAVLFIILLSASGDQPRNPFSGIPLLESLFGDSLGAAAKCPPSAVDTAMVRGLIRHGDLSARRGLWFVVLPDSSDAR